MRIAHRTTNLGTNGFTMVEIALSLAIIGFALVAIIGVLPTGLEVQRTNLEDTMVNQEGNFFLQAIRSGAQGLDDLTNCVDWIRRDNTTLPINIVRDGGRAIIGLLSTPKYYLNTGTGTWTKNYDYYMVAKVRSMSGAASDKSAFARTNDLSFSYLLQSEIVPFAAYPTNYAQTNFNASGLNPNEQWARRDLWAQGNVLATNLYELRLTLRWPVHPDGSAGDRQQTFRALLSGRFISGWDTTNRALYLYFFRPSIYGP
ncbi:MAG: hypothetical protein M1608_02495 [Candidatus Omnitrophica bacterium]|nr:hypothetical protein [Candidatus Omnitrophota bacterium]